MSTVAKSVTVRLGEPPEHVMLPGDLVVPEAARGVVLFAHGSGSSRHSPRNRAVAGMLQERRLGTLLMDLLTGEEERLDQRTGELRFDIGLLGRRLTGTVDQLAIWEETRDRPLGLFGASTGAAGALLAAAKRPELVRAVVSRGGRPDLAGDALPTVRAAVLFIVGGLDHQVIGLNRQAMERVTAPLRLEIVAGATHLFPEPGALERVGDLAATWFEEHL